MVVSMQGYMYAYIYHVCSQGISNMVVLAEVLFTRVVFRNVQ